MIIKEYTKKDTTFRNRLYVDVQCTNCTSIFTRQKRQLKDFYCSQTCRNLNNGSTVLLVCAHCNAEFLRSKSKLINSKSGIYFCSRSCKDTAQVYMVQIQPEHYGTGSDYRSKALRSLKNECNSCSYNNLSALEVHHKDKNRLNNDISNLEILCANCHTIEHKNYAALEVKT